MRWVLMVISFTVIAATIVHFRCSESRAIYDTRRHKACQVTLEIQLWAQQVYLGRLTSPDAVRNAAERMTLGLAERGAIPFGTADGQNAVAEAS